MNFQMFKLDIEKAKEPEIKLPTIVGSSKKKQNTRKTSTSTLLIMPKPLTVFSSVQSLIRAWLFVTPWSAARQASLSIINSQSLLKLNPSHWWCHPTISSSVIPFFPYLQSSPALGSFQMSRFFSSDGKSIAVSASTSLLPMNIQDWFPLGVTGLTSLQSKGVLKSLLQHHSPKASILWCSAFFIV